MPRLARTISLALAVALAAGCGARASAPAVVRPAVAEATIGAAVGEAFTGVALVARGRGEPATVLARGVPAHHGFRIGSVSKWLTAILALRLTERGVFGLDEPIARWLPDLRPPLGQRVTLRLLMQNTSGIPDGVMAAAQADPAIAHSRLTAAAAAQAFATGPLGAPAWGYTVTNWVIVRAVLEAASGVVFEELLGRELIRPLRLAGTQIPPEPEPGAAPPADAPAAGPPVPAFAAASGTIVSTAADLRQIADALATGALLQPASRKQLETVAVPAEHYALGGRVRAERVAGEVRQVWWQTGKLGPARALLAYEPRSGACVVLLTEAGLEQDALAAAARKLLAELPP